MAETTEEIYHNNQEDITHKEEEEESNDNKSSMHPNSSFLVEMNLVMIIASLTLSDQELLEFEDIDKTSDKDHDAKALVSKLKTQKREFDQLKIPDRRTPRVQMKVLDSRHGRKM